MLEFDNIRLELENYETPVATLKDSLHIDHVMTQISELEARTQEPDFWNDVEKANKTSKEASDIKRDIEDYKHLSTSFDDIGTMIDLANEDGDINLIPASSPSR